MIGDPKDTIVDMSKLQVVRTQIKQCVVRSFKHGWNKTTDNLSDKLNSGWIVRHITPFVIDNTIEYIEYILEKEILV